LSFSPHPADGQIAHDTHCFGISDSKTGCHCKTTVRCLLVIYHEMNYSDLFSEFETLATFEGYTDYCCYRPPIQGESTYAIFVVQVPLRDLPDL